jgi:hypothetical protein
MTYLVDVLVVTDRAGPHRVLADSGIARRTCEPPGEDLG